MTADSPQRLKQPNAEGCLKMSLNAGWPLRITSVLSGIIRLLAEEMVVMLQPETIATSLAWIVPYSAASTTARWAAFMIHLMNCRTPLRIFGNGMRNILTNRRGPCKLLYE